MSKSRDCIKEGKKQPTRTAKEKRAAKLARKHPVQTIPVIPPGKI